MHTRARQGVNQERCSRIAITSSIHTGAPIGILEELLEVGQIGIRTLSITEELEVSVHQGRDLLVNLDQRGSK